MPGTKLSFLATTAAMIFSLCGVLRLARFRVSSSEAKDNAGLVKDQLKHFTGLPIPAAAAAAVSLNLFIFSDDSRSFFQLANETQIWILSIAQILLGYCMISRWKFPSVKTLEIRVASFRIVFLTVLAAAMIFYGILHYFALVFLVISWGYFIIAWTLSIIRLIAGRKSKTLEEFEPEPDELDDDIEFR